VPAPKIRTVVPNAPELLEELIGELLEKRPERRTPTALALLRKLEHIENELRDHSEAKTAHSIKPPQVFQRQDTFRLGEPLDMLNQKTGDPGLTVRPAGEKTDSSKKAKATSADVETAVLHAPLELEPPPKKTKPHDYFSTVTDQQRRQQVASERPSEKKSNNGWLLILLGLLATTGVSIFGVYYATKPLTADQLFSTIEMGASQPEQVREQLTDFLRMYADDERAPKVQQLQEIANAAGLYKKLYLRRNMPGNERLSQIEKQFVEIIDDARENLPTGFSRLDAFITVHDNGPETSTEVAELIAAAKSFRIKIKFDATNQASWDRQRISEALDRAADDPEKAAEIYRSIIKLYEDIDWAEALVSRAKSQLDELE
jgi:serine/threonine-protein kinase